MTQYNRTHSKRTVLITGGAGFLGLACARRFRAAGWRVAGLGRRDWNPDQSRAAGYDVWINAGVTTEALAGLVELGEQVQAVAHCAGNGSVPYSLQQPLDAYERTVESTAILLEHLRRHAPAAVVLYPSSAAVYGTALDHPLLESDPPNPVSPYGFHKEMVETLLASHATCFGQPAIAIRFFSIYGAGLRKQLLWEASRRLLSGDSPQTFFGDGGETRDWLHVDDAAGLMVHLAERSLAAPQMRAQLDIVNGATGERITVRDILGRLARALGSSAEIRFNGNVRAGDPYFYQASVTRMHAMGWRPSIALDDGLASLAAWVRTALREPA